MLSKKRSDAKPPDGTVFFVDRSLGVEPIRSALVVAAFGLRFMTTTSIRSAWGHQKVPIGQILPAARPARTIFENRQSFRARLFGWVEAFEFAVRAPFQHSGRGSPWALYSIARPITVLSSASSQLRPLHSLKHGFYIQFGFGFVAGSAIRGTRRRVGECTGLCGELVVQLPQFGCW